MPQYLPPSQRQSLIQSIEAYIAQHYRTQIFPVFGKIRPEPSISDVYDKKRFTAAASPPPSSLKPDASQCADDDWNTPARIFSNNKPTESSTKRSADSRTTSIYDLIERSDDEETFSEALLRIIQEKQLTEPDVYNSVFMDRKLFNKIRNTPEYQPSKRTALLLAIALKLDLEQTQTFIGKAGFQLVHWNKFDIIVEYFIVNGNYNVFEINEMLAEFKMPLLLRCD